MPRAASTSTPRRRAAQEIDAAAMMLWIKYRQHDGNLDGGAFAGGLDAFTYVSTGGIVYF